MVSRAESRHDPDLPAPSGPRRGRGRRRLLAVVGSVVALAVLVGIAKLPLLPLEATAKARMAADTAVEALHDGDLAALDRHLSANRADREFAYYFTREATPRALGDVLVTAAVLNVRAPAEPDAGTAQNSATRAGLDTTGYERALTDLADILALATRGTGDLALPTSWTDDFTTYTTTPRLMYGDESSGDTQRVDQDVANKQNLLLLLSRGRWSTGFLQKTTEAYWAWEHHPAGVDDRGPWPGRTIATAKYASAPSGVFLVDGMVALMAALTANPEAAGWAFADFQPGTVDVDYGGAGHPMGKVAHYLFFERPAANPGGVTGMTASVTALMSAIQATGGSYADHAVGPVSDLSVLRDYQAAVAAEQASGHWWDSWGPFAHVALDLLSMVPLVGIPFAIGSAAWSALEQDWASVGLATLALVPFVGGVAVAGKLLKDAGKIAKLVDRLGGAIDESTEAGKLLSRAVRVDDGVYDFASAGDFVAALKNPVSGVTYKYGDTTFELAADGKSLTHLSGPDKDVLERGLAKDTAAGRDEGGHYTGDPVARAIAKDKEELGLRAYEAATGSTVIRAPKLAHVNGLENGRLYDGLAHKPDGTYEGVEVKSGKAVQSTNQRAFDDRVSVQNPATGKLSDGTPIQITSVHVERVA